MKGTGRCRKLAPAAVAAAVCLLPLPALASAPGTASMTFTPDAWFQARGAVVSASTGTAPPPPTPASTAPTPRPSSLGFVPDGWYSHGTTVSGGAAAGGANAATGGSPGTAQGTGGSGGAASGGSGAAGGNPPNLASDSAEIIAWTNQQRASAGLPPLAENAILDRVALAKCDDMINNGYFGHDSPTYGTPLQMQQAFGIQARIMGAENIAGARTTALAWFMLITSPGHLANIEYNGLTDQGAAVVPYGVYGVYVCQEFIGS